MRKALFIMVSVALAFSFTGCSNGEETPTDVLTSGTASQVESFVQGVEEKAGSDQGESSVVSQVSKGESNVVSASSKGETTGSLQGAENFVVSKTSSVSLKAEIVEEDLEFTTEAQLKNWFKNGTQVANAVSPEALQTMQQGKAVTYLRPAISANNNLVSLKNIVVEKATIGYEYSFVGQEKAELVMIAHLKDFDQLFYEEFETNLSKEKENYFRTSTNGIEYLYMRNVSSDSVVFVWKQNGVVHSAILYGHYDQVDQILPLLKLETVTVQTDNQSHVTQ